MGLSNPAKLKASPVIDREINPAYSVSKEFQMKTCLPHKTFWLYCSCCIPQWEFSLSLVHRCWLRPPISLLFFFPHNKILLTTRRAQLDMVGQSFGEINVNAMLLYCSLIATKASNTHCMLRADTCDYATKLGWKIQDVSMSTSSSTCKMSDSFLFKFQLCIPEREQKNSNTFLQKNSAQQYKVEAIPFSLWL